MPGGDVLFRLFDGFALTAGGAIALVASLVLSGVFELVKHAYAADSDRAVSIGVDFRAFESHPWRVSQDRVAVAQGGDDSSR